jgi:CBS domain-containing protein
MKIEQIMTRDVRTCRPDDSLNQAAQLMWESDCGALPVIDAEGRAIAMITDRDICMAAYTQGQPLWNMTVSSAASRDMVTAKASDSLDDAEALMQTHQVRRIPVVDDSGRPIGIVSMNDLARHAHVKVPSRADGLSADSIVRTLAGVCRPSPAAHVAE